MSKKITVLIAMIVYLLSAYFSYSFFKTGAKNEFKSPIASLYKPPKTGAENLVVENEPKTEACPINGALLTKSQKESWESRRPLGVMIENHKDARPQSGLSSADVIYEAVAEGGITRFLTIFYCQEAAYVGPVRSARVYFIDLLSEYGNYPLYAHVGGANTDGPADALGKISKLKWNLYNDLNQFAVPFPYYWRDYERLPGRITEHTVYSAPAKLWQFAKAKRHLSDVDEDGVKWDENFVSWEFKDDEPVKTPTVQTISFDFWSNKPEYSVAWEYQPTTNTFKRSNGGSPHFDKNNNQQLESKNVIIVLTQESSANDGYAGGHLLYKLIGQGKALVFQDGQVKEGLWTKEAVDERMRFYTNANTEIALNRGQVFIEIVPKGNTITY